MVNVSAASFLRWFVFAVLYWAWTSLLDVKSKNVTNVLNPIGSTIFENTFKKLLRIHGF